MVDRAHTDAELDAAIAKITDPKRLREAEDLVMRAAPALQRVLAEALADGGWFDVGHEQAVREATSEDDPGERVRAVRTMIAEETRLGMLVGVAVGFELARELARPSSPSSGQQDSPGQEPSPQQPSSGQQLQED